MKTLIENIIVNITRESSLYVCVILRHCDKLFDVDHNERVDVELIINPDFR
jgi:hypothetical protein